MTFLEVDVLGVLEDALPARFGGGPGDYQLVEDETDDGRPRIRLFVRPGVGPDDLRAVGDALLLALGSASAAERVMSLAWSDGGVVHVERRAPVVLPSGKIRPVHRLPRPQAGPQPARP
jgi:hypothetical protein